MASQYFSPAIDLAPSRRPGKRKAQSNEDESEHESRTRAGLMSTTSDDEADEGQSEDDEDAVLPAGFPAAPLRHDFNVPESKKRASQRQRNLKQQHFAAINAVLHKCLLGGDYVRASQAFGLLLRLEVNKQHVDLRKKSLWGIGAEILLHKYNLPAADGKSVSTATSAFDSSFSSAGFAATKAFFERLILQYPLRKQRASDTNELTFYPAMLGLWVFQIQARYRTGSQSSKQPDVDDSSPDDEQEYDGIDSGAMAQQLKEAQEVADRIESLTHFPPFDRHAPTLKLHADVLSWLADLTAKSQGDQSSVTSLRERAERIKRHLYSLAQTSTRA